MSHKFKVGQAVVQAFRSLDHSVTYQIVRLMPVCFWGEPQYLIQCRLQGVRRLVREEEIVAAFPSGALSAWAGTSSDMPAARVRSRTIPKSGADAPMTDPTSLEGAPSRAEQAKWLIQEARLARMRADLSVSSTDQEMAFTRGSGAATFPVGSVVIAMAET